MGEFFLIGEHLANVTTKSVVVSCTLHAWPTLLNDEESAQDNHVFACNFAKCSLIKNKFSLVDSAINLS